MIAKDVKLLIFERRNTRKLWVYKAETSEFRNSFIYLNNGGNETERLLAM